MSINIISSHQIVYKGLLFDIASIYNEDDRKIFFQENFKTLVGLLILIDIDENKGMENYDPLIQNTNPVLLNIIGNLLVDSSDAHVATWSKILAENVKINMIDYYRAQIESDLDDAIEDVRVARKDIDSQADRARDYV